MTTKIDWQLRWCQLALIGDNDKKWYHYHYTEGPRKGFGWSGSTLLSLIRESVREPKSNSAMLTYIQQVCPEVQSDEQARYACARLHEAANGYPIKCSSDETSSTP